MTRNVFQNGAALFRVIEDSPAKHLRSFFLQLDDNFRPVHQGVEVAAASATDDDLFRNRVLQHFNKMTRDEVEPIEVECRRVLDLTEARGPTSLKTIIERQLSNEDCEEFDEQPGDLARSLWAHVKHRKEFDDAVSFKAIRSWRNAGRLYAAFNVDLDGKGGRFSAAEVDPERLAGAIGKKLKTSRSLSISLIDLPKVPEHLPAVLVIVRFAGQQTSVATHGESGERRLLYYLPQDEAVLIYTPADERIEVAATRAVVRNAVAQCFASETLRQDLSAKPLVSATYDTSRFLRSMDLPLPEVSGFTVLSAKLADLELRVENWQTRLALRAGGTAEMEALVERYLGPSGVLRRALGVSKLLIVVSYQQQDDETRRILEIAVSDGNSCSLNSERDPVIRNFGRKLLEAWGLLRAFCDIDDDQAIDLIPVMAELWELDQKTQNGSYFVSRGIHTKPLEDARLIRKKEVEPKLLEEEEDEEIEGPTMADRTIYAVDLDWVHERLLTALKSVVDAAAPEDLPRSLAFIGLVRIDERDVNCYLARGLDQLKTFTSVDEHLRGRSGSGPGIVFTGKAVGPRLIGANVVVPVVKHHGEKLDIGVDRTAVAAAFRNGRSLALGAGTLELVEDLDHAAARLHVPGEDPLDLFSEPAVIAFRLLVDAARRGAPGVASGELIKNSGSTGFEQMIGRTRWPIVKTYVEPNGPRRWKLKGY